MVGAGRRLVGHPRRRGPDAFPGADAVRRGPPRGSTASSAAGSGASARCATTAAAGGRCTRAPGRSPRRCSTAPWQREHDLLVPFSEAAAAALRDQRSARLDTGAERCLVAAEMGLDPPPSRLAMVGGVDGRALVLEVLWDAEAGSGVRRPAGRRAPPRSDRPVARPADRRVHRPARCPRHARRGAGARRAARRARRGVRGGARVAGDRGRADRRRRRRARRQARAVSVGRGALRAARPGAHSWPTSRGSARRSRRSPRSRPTRRSRPSWCARRR